MTINGGGTSSFQFCDEIAMVDEGIHIEGKNGKAFGTQITINGELLGIFDEGKPKEIPLAPEDDPVRQFLRELEERYLKLQEKYKNNPEKTKELKEELGNIRHIIVCPESIRLAGIDLQRENEVFFNKKDINIDGNTYFSDKVTGIPTLEEWKKILEVIPGKIDNTQVENFMRILGMSYSGCFDRTKWKVLGSGRYIILQVDSGSRWPTLLMLSKKGTFGFIETSDTKNNAAIARILVK